jgi:hypothetical protein
MTDPAAVVPDPVAVVADPVAPTPDPPPEHPVDQGVAVAATATEAGVVEQVDRILAWSRTNESRIGYFAALYWHVATTLSEALKRGEFEHSAEMERLNDVFFHRYLTAVHDLWAGRAPTQAWQVAFAAATDNDLIVVQQLLLGANAHINLDLAIAVAEAIPQADLAAFEPDYLKMNELLCSLIAGMSADISRFWPLLRLVSRLLGGADDAIVAFSLRKAREEAWATALLLAAMDPSERTAAIAQRDGEVADLARLVVNPGWVIGGVLRLLRQTERGSILEIIEDLLKTTRGVLPR